MALEEHEVSTRATIDPVGQISYSLAPMVASGRMFGLDQPVILHLLDIETAKAPLEGVRMELLDAAFPLLRGVSRCCTHVQSASVISLSVVKHGAWVHAVIGHAWNGPECCMLSKVVVMSTVMSNAAAGSLDHALDTGRILYRPSFAEILCLIIAWSLSFPMRHVTHVNTYM